MQDVFYGTQLTSTSKAVNRKIMKLYLMGCTGYQMNRFLHSMNMGNTSTIPTKVELQ